MVVKSDNSIWFTDPAYGIDTDYEGHKAESEIGGTTFTGWTRKPARSRSLPAISFDPTALHFLLTKANSSSPILAHLTSQTVRAIRIFDVADNGTLSGGDVFAVCTSGFFDGFRFDTEGRLWRAGDGVHCYDPDGTLIGKILVPGPVANVDFGGPKRNRMFICATACIYSISFVNGVKRF